jgi:four helix bundle protein
MGDFKKLQVWKYAHALALDTFRAVEKIRGPQHIALRSQLNRAAASIPANIVEGRSKPSERDFSRFIGYAIGSAAELEYHLILARDTEAMEKSEALGLLSQLTKVRRMLYGLRDALSHDATRPRPDPANADT